MMKRSEVPSMSIFWDVSVDGVDARLECSTLKSMTPRSAVHGLSGYAGNFYVQDPSELMLCWVFRIASKVL